MYGGLHAYEVSRQLSANDPPFASLIFSAMRKADSLNQMRLQATYPELWEELHERYWAPGGKLEGER